MVGKAAVLSIWGSRRYSRHAQHDMTLIIPSTGSCQVKLVNEYGATISCDAPWHD